MCSHFGSGLAVERSLHVGGAAQSCAVLPSRKPCVLQEVRARGRAGGTTQGGRAPHRGCPWLRSSCASASSNSLPSSLAPTSCSRGVAGGQWGRAAVGKAQQAPCGCCLAGHPGPTAAGAGAGLIASLACPKGLKFSAVMSTACSCSTCRSCPSAAAAGGGAGAMPDSAAPAAAAPAAAAPPAPCRLLGCAGRSMLEWCRGPGGRWTRGTAIAGCRQAVERGHGERQEASMGTIRGAEGLMAAF